MKTFVQPGKVLELPVTTPLVPAAGVTCLFGAGITGVAILAEGEGGAAADNTMVRIGGGVYDLVVATSGAIAAGDALWLHSASPNVLNNVAAAGYFFGFALEAIASGSATINVLHVPRGVGLFGSGTVGTDELAANNVTAAKLTATLRKGFIPLDITRLMIPATNVVPNTMEGFYLDGNTAPILERVNEATDKALRVRWAASSSIEVQFPPVPKPPDMDGTAAWEVHLMLAKDTNTDNTVTVDVQLIDDTADTEAGAVTAALAVATLAEYSASLAAGDLAEAPGFINIGLVPGTHTTDAIHLYAAWVEYTRI